MGSGTVQLEDEVSKEPLKDLKKLLGEEWTVTFENNRFVCSVDGRIYHTSAIHLGLVYMSTLLSIAYTAKQSYKR